MIVKLVGGDIYVDDTLLVSQPILNIAPGPRLRVKFRFKEVPYDLVIFRISGWRINLDSSIQVQITGRNMITDSDFNFTTRLYAEKHMAVVKGTIGSKSIDQTVRTVQDLCQVLTDINPQI